MTSETEINAAAQALLQNPEFMEIFQRAVLHSGDDSSESKTATTTNSAAAEKVTDDTIAQKPKSEVGKKGNVSENASELLKSIPQNDDPKREEWLRSLQHKLQQESMRAAQKDLEQVHSDEDGQWMYILPTPGFCIKCAVAGGGKVFVNICQHERIAEPMPMSSNVDCMTSPAVDNGEVQFRVPLSCGQAKPDKDKAGRPCKVYDVIVNPRTLERCSKDAEFRRFVAALCMQWIKQKSEPTLNIDEFRNLNFKVKGTLEPQRIRISTQPKAANALQNEINLPQSNNAPTAPTRIQGTLKTGKLIEELEESTNGIATTNTTNTSNATTREMSNNANNDHSNNINGGHIMEEKESLEDSKLTTSKSPCVLHVREEGMYDWHLHKKPASNIYFRENVPAMYAVELYIPNISSIAEVDVRLSPKRLECFYVDEDNNDESEVNNGGNKKGNVVNKDIAPVTSLEPFLSVVFDYPVQQEVAKAKFIKKESRLKVQLKVQIPDETDTTVSRTNVARDAAEEEEEEALQQRQEQQRKWEEEKERRARIESEETTVMNERKSYVADLSAIQAGDLPPTLVSEIDKMPKEQLPIMLMRLEKRIRQGDSIDTLLESMSEDVLTALCTHIRNKLSLQPLETKTVSNNISKDNILSNIRAETNNNNSSNNEKEKNATNKAANKSSLPSTQNDLKEYNYAKKAEQLFGVEFHNRYLFALDN